MTAQVQPYGHQAGADYNIHHNRSGERKGIAPGNRRRCGDTEKVDQLQRLSPEQIDKVKGNTHTAPDGGHRHQRAPDRIQPEQQNHIHDKNAQYIQCHVSEFHLIENIIVDVFDQQESTDIRRQNNGKIPRPYSLFQFFAVLSSQLPGLHDKHRQPSRDRNRGRQKNKNQIPVLSVIQIGSHDLPVLRDQKNQNGGKIAEPENQVFFGSWKMSSIPYDLCAWFCLVSFCAVRFSFGFDTVRFTAMSFSVWFCTLYFTAVSFFDRLCDIRLSVSCLFKRRFSIRLQARGRGSCLILRYSLCPLCTFRLILCVKIHLDIPSEIFPSVFPGTPKRTALRPVERRHYTPWKKN